MENNQNLENQENVRLLDQVEQKLSDKQIVFIEEKSVVTFEELEDLRLSLGEDKRLYVCDFYIEGQDDLSEAKFEGHKLTRGKIENIDHHSKDHRLEVFKGKIFASSALLALEEVEKNPDFLENSVVVVHHTDTDSVLTSLIMSGIVSAENARKWHFRRAAVSADHTGEDDRIANLLQSLRSGEYVGQSPEERLMFSVRNLELLLNNKEIEDSAKVLLDKYLAEKESLKDVVKEGRYGDVEGLVNWLELPATSEADAVSLPALFPDALVVFMSRPKLDKEGNPTLLYNMNVRLGKKALEKNLDLREVMQKAELPFGGRFNAGANKRKGGTDLSPEQFAKKIYEALTKNSD